MLGGQKPSGSVDSGYSGCDLYYLQKYQGGKMIRIFIVPLLVVYTICLLVILIARFMWESAIYLIEDWYKERRKE